MNHMGKFELAKELVVESKRAGADAVKFQYHIADAEMLPTVQIKDGGGNPLYEFIQKNALTIDQHKKLMALAEKEDITYLCTPFSTQAALELNEIGLSAFKIGSGELTDTLSLERIAECKKPMLVSTGMSTLEEIDRTYELLIEKNVPLALLNCISEYPPVYEDMNMDFITVMKNRYPHAVIGHSDHTVDAYTSLLAVMLGANIVEKHIILDKSEKGGDWEVSLDCTEFAAMVDGIRKIEASRGTERKVHTKEQPTRDWALHYAVAARGLKAGTVITEDMIAPGNIWTKRTGESGGIAPADVKALIGATVKEDIAPNSALKAENFALAIKTTA
jgi:N-acetylneuraminate synthase